MAPQRNRNDATTCSFCGKRHDEVNKLIAGPDVNICDECVHLCGEIVSEDRARKGTTRTEEVPTPTKIKSFLDEYVLGPQHATLLLPGAVHTH